MTHVFLFCKIFTFPVFLGFRGVRILNKDRIRYSKVGLFFSKVVGKCGNFDDFQKSRFFQSLKPGTTCGKIHKNTTQKNLHPVKEDISVQLTQKKSASYLKRFGRTGLKCKQVVSQIDKKLAKFPSKTLRQK